MRKLKIKKVDDEPMVIHTKKKAKLLSRQQTQPEQRQVPDLLLQNTEPNTEPIHKFYWNYTGRCGRITMLSNLIREE